MQLWVDDLRTPPEGWMWAKTSQEAIGFFTDPTVMVEEMSLDHDLGGDDTSRKLVLWICEHDFCFPPVVRVHTANPVGRDWLVAMVNRYGPGVTR